MLWKKRWFVLSEYCLFYYKGEEEEKVLGSILLPSYKISPCSAEDRVFKKFSFKAEHANMRTYYFAADSRELMIQWMNALSLASILQESNPSWAENRTALSSNSSHHNHSTDDSDSGFHGNYPPLKKMVAMKQVNEVGNDYGTTMPKWQNNHCENPQPLYANAPPKPRRLNNEASPERSPEENGRISRMAAQPQEYPRMHNYNRPNTLPNAHLFNNSERRTPDTYGRSYATAPSAHKPSGVKKFDYEDVYHNNQENSVYVSNKNMINSQIAQSQMAVHYRKRPHNVISPTQKRYPPRPHSADFLEYDARKYEMQNGVQSPAEFPGTCYANQGVISTQPRRPKSSLDIINTSDFLDYHHWSEESYAQKMRQSALYVSPTFQNHVSPLIAARTTTPSTKLPFNQTSPYLDSPTDSASVQMRNHSNVILEQERQWNEYIQSQNRNSSHSQFIRSASARLPRHSDFVDDALNFEDCSEKNYNFERRNSTDSREGERKTQQREESMKRLLEWKQRMLQSPLSRKSSGSSKRGTAQNELSKGMMNYDSKSIPRKEISDMLKSNSFYGHDYPVDCISSNQKIISETKNAHYNSDTWPTKTTSGTNPSNESWDSSADSELRTITNTANHNGDIYLHQKYLTDSNMCNRTRNMSKDGSHPGPQISRFNSYSSDDEELEQGCDEPREKLPTKIEEKAIAKDNPTNMTPDYENISMVGSINTSYSSVYKTDYSNSLNKYKSSKSSSNTNSHFNHSFDFLKDSKLIEQAVMKPSYSTYSSPEKGNESQFDKNLLPFKHSVNLNDSNTMSKKFSKCNGSSDTNDSQSFNGNSSYEDRYTVSSKHSDSGYDTLQTSSRRLPTDSLNNSSSDYRSPNSTVSFSPQPAQTKTLKALGKDYNWIAKLDENRLIKEFSYQYINPKSNKDDEPVMKKSLAKQYETPPENIVQNRIKAFEVSSDDNSSSKSNGKLKMQEPLKPLQSKYQPNEAHISVLSSTETESNLFPTNCPPVPDEVCTSNLWRSKRRNLHNLGSPIDLLDEEMKYSKREYLLNSQNPKSVRDLLADFERKSQLSKEEQILEENCINLNRENGATSRADMLYDISSRDQTTSDILSRLQRMDTPCSEEDKDEEVSAVLSQQDNFFSPCQDRDMEQYSRKTPDSTLSADTKSAVANGTCPPPRPVESKPPLSNFSYKNVPPPHFHRKSSSFDSSQEEHYMPMTPSKKNSLSSIADVFCHTRSNSASQTIIIEDLLRGDESSYVEMTENGMIKSLLAPGDDQQVYSKADQQNQQQSEGEAPRYLNMRDTKNYDFLYKSNPQHEPLYMEVNSVIEEIHLGSRHNSVSSNSKSEVSSSMKKEDLPPAPPRTALPDILSPSSTNSGQQQSSVKSDSSDADDEASKDLDSLDAPRHPRFSLSDTFRPASYYLGAGSNRNLIGLSCSEQHDSSDSDLVSPPPIPTSPPPLDDLDTSLEITDSSLDINKSDCMKLEPPLTMSSIKDDRKLWNTGSDLKTIHERMELLMQPPNGTLDDTFSSDTDSIDSTKRDKLKRQPVSPEILDCLEREPYFGSTSSGRRSVGSDLDSIGSRNGLAMDDNESIDFDMYLSDLQVNHPLEPENSATEFNNDFYQNYLKKSSGLLPMKQFAHPPAVKPMYNGEQYEPQPCNSEQDHKAPENEEIHYENVQNLHAPPMSEPCEDGPRPNSQMSDGTARCELPPKRKPMIEVPQLPHLPGGTPSAQDLFNAQIGAPYYYSDLLKVEIDNYNAENKNINIRPDGTLQPLNNQRDSPMEGLCLSKRNDIGRKVNQIRQFARPIDGLSETDAAKLAAELKNTSTQFFVPEKCQQFDQRNLYDPDTLQRRKSAAMLAQKRRSQTPEPLGNTRNLYPHGLRDKSVGFESESTRRLSRSLEGLLDDNDLYSPGETRNNRTMSPGNAISRLLQTTQPQNTTPRLQNNVQNMAACFRGSSRVPPPPPDVWEEDALWRENLRRVSLRQTQSLDDLDQTPERPQQQSGRQSVDILSSTNRFEEMPSCNIAKPQVPRNPTRVEQEIDDGVHYERLVRDSKTETMNNFEYCRKDKNLIPGRQQVRNGPQSFLEEGLYPTRPPSFEIDREKLRQWDLMSSAPAGMLGASDGVPALGLGLGLGPNTGMGMGLRALKPTPGAASEESQIPAAQVPGTQTLVRTEAFSPPSSQASESGSMIGRDPLPPRLAGPNQPVNGVASPEKLPGNCNHLLSSSPHHRSNYPKTSVSPLNPIPHSPLNTLNTMNNVHRPCVDPVQQKRARYAELDAPKRLEHLQKLEDLKRHLLELEKQYEKGKPLVNLVDNMVKLGSLYRVGSTVPPSNVSLLQEKIEFNHKVQEQRLLAEERRDWERLNPDQNQLQAKVEQLYYLDRVLQEESGTLQSLQQDKEILEQALFGLRHKLQGVTTNPIEVERYRRQQLMLEKELSRVRSVLAHNSKKLEETVTANARLEAELVVLRQKFSWRRRGANEGSGGGPTVAALESELSRVQALVGDLQRQRQELSTQVRQLTEKSHSLGEQIRPGPTGVAGAGPIPAKKKTMSGWLETDLDSQVTQDVGAATESLSPLTISPQHLSHTSPIPLYVNTDGNKSPDPCMNGFDSSSTDEKSDPMSPPANQPRTMDISEADERIKRYYGIIPRDKPQEIKTVRIVKRESERRQRDRDRSGNLGIPITNTSSAKRVTVIEEISNENYENQLLGSVDEINEDDDLTNDRSMSLPRGFGSRNNKPDPPPPPTPRSDSIHALRNIVNKNPRFKVDSDSSLKSRSAREQLFGSNGSVEASSARSSTENSPQLSPVYQSEAARQIIQEISGKESVKLPNGVGKNVTNNNKRLVPREKRRHHTVSSGRPLISLDSYPYQNVSRARDDLDMERALRPRLNGAPDVVRSTLSRTDPVKYNAETIDSILGTPSKIIIPERYIPESEPQLSPEEQSKRLKKAEAIRKMLSETSVSQSEGGEEPQKSEQSVTLKKKVAEEKRQREHLLQLNQILAHQVMEKSKMVAGLNCSGSQE
nr:PREDICTED: uncharacterized protein LOC109030629 isoform X1 [Bemisia tabaci]